MRTVAEYCLDCFNKIEHTNFKENQVIQSQYPSICEGCKQPQKVVIRVRRSVLTVSEESRGHFSKNTSPKQPKFVIKFLDFLNQL